LCDVHQREAQMHSLSFGNALEGVRIVGIPKRFTRFPITSIFIEVHSSLL
jgi:hypothetical protein